MVGMGKHSTMFQVRDLTVMDLNGQEILVVACDSVGGIGSKPHDKVKADGAVVGAFALRVPLFELISAGAAPVLVVNTLSVEWDPAGREIVRGLKAYAKQAGLDVDVQFTGSTEENVSTVQTGVGITVLGKAEKARFFPGSSRQGDWVVCAGWPKSAPDDDVRLDDPQILSIEELYILRQQPDVHDILPVGSKGILYEAQELANSAGLASQLEVQKGRTTLDLEKSAGPSTCVIFSAKEEAIGRLQRQLKAPLTVIGRLN